MPSRAGVAVACCVLSCTAVGLLWLPADVVAYGTFEGTVALAEEQPVAAAASTPVLGTPQAETESASDERTEQGAVIPPGQEELLAQMLGRGAALPAQCVFAGAEADHAVVRATYDCPSGAVVFELSHPSKAARGATQTDRFAIAVQGGTPPSGLADALAALIRSKEAAFEWKWLGNPERSFSRATMVLTALGVLVVAGLGWVLRRRRVG
jgi:hypothetical protein